MAVGGTPDLFLASVLDAHPLLESEWVPDLGDLPEADAYLFEAGLYFGAAKLSPFLQYLERDYALESLADQTTWQAGLAYYPMGHRLAVKLGVGEVENDGSAARMKAMREDQWPCSEVRFAGSAA